MQIWLHTCLCANEFAQVKYCDFGLKEQMNKKQAEFNKNPGRVTCYSVLQALWQKVHLPSPQPLSQRERGLEEPSLSDGNWWPDIAPTSPSPSGRGVRGEGKNGEGKKGEGKISILPNILKNALYLNEQRIRVVRFWSSITIPSFPRSAWECIRKHQQLKLPRQVPGRFLGPAVVTGILGPAVVTGIAETWLRLTQSMGTRKKCKSTAFALLQQTTPQIRYNQ